MGVLITELYAFNILGKNAPMKIVVTLLNSPIPRRTMNRGNSAIFGMGNKQLTTGIKIFFTWILLPMKMPIVVPINIPIDQPTTSLHRLVHRL